MVHAPKPGEERTKFNLSVYDNAWRWVDAHYYDPNFNGADWAGARERHRAAAAAAQDDTALYAAINAMLRELKDPHTFAQSAPQFARFFWHVNVTLGWRLTDVPGATDGRLRVREVFPKSDAAAAGVRRGWTLLTCNGQPALEFVRAAATSLREGDVVRCELLTEREEPRTLTLTARRVAEPTLREIVEVAPQIFLLRFDSFDFAAAKWVREQVKAHADAKALIFDLRRNPGGHLFAVGSILGDIYPAPVDMGELVHRGDRAWWPALIRQRGGAHYSGKVAVLVSRSSASASEVFAQLVNESGRGLVVGQKTRGALLTTVYWPLAGGGKLWVSLYDYHSPQGVRIEQNGVIPNIIVPQPPPLSAEDRDPVVDAAVKALSETTAPPL